MFDYIKILGSNSFANKLQTKFYFLDVEGISQEKSSIPHKSPLGTTKNSIIIVIIIGACSALAM